MRGGAGRSGLAITAIAVAIVFFLAGLGIGYFVFSPVPRAKLIVGTNAPFAPFESYNDTTGAFEGFDMSIAKLVADALGRDLVVRNFNSWDLLLATTGQGGVDMTVSAMTMSGPKGAERNATMSFSNPYYLADQAVVIRSNYAFSCPNNICTRTQIINHTIGVQSGTTSDGWVIQYIQGNQTQAINRYQSVVPEIDALTTSVYDLMIIDQGPAKAIAAGSGGALKVAGIIQTGELYGIAVKRGDPKNLLPTINSVLAQIKADGRYDQLIAKWFTT